MTDLPPGWEWTRLDEVADIQGGIQKQPRRRPTFNKYPFLRVANVARGRLHLSDIHEIELFDGELERYQIKAGDLLVVEGNGSLDQLGRAAMWRDQIVNCVHQNHLIRVRPTQAMNPQYLEYLWNSRFITEQVKKVGASTSGLHTLSVSKLRPIVVPIPPLAEQCRIVAALDSHLSRLDAGLSEAATARSRLATLWQSVLNWQLSCPGHGNTWSIKSLGELSHDSSYGTSVKCAYNGQGVAVVRIPNIVGGRIKLTDMKYAMDADADLSSLYLTTGDILFVRTNGSRSLIGRTGVVEEVSTKIAFASYLIRFRLHVEIVRPRWISHVLESPKWRQMLEREAASSAGQYNLSLTKLERIAIPLPGLAEQDAILAELGDQCSANERLESSLLVTTARGEALRRSLLATAFSGFLVRQDPNDEPASVLLERIKVERAAQPKAKRVRRTPQKSNVKESVL